MESEFITYLKDPVVITVFGVILAFLFGLLGTLFYFNRLKKKEKEDTRKKIFKQVWESSKKLEYDIPGREQQTEMHPSTQAGLDEKITKALKERKNILLYGESMSGKTHFTINYLRKLKSTRVLIPNCEKFDGTLNTIPKPFRKGQYNIIFIDDIYSYLNTGTTGVTSFISKAMKEKYIIWANTLSGVDYENVRNDILEKIDFTFEQINIPSTLSRDEGFEIAQITEEKILPTDFDHNIGSIFYPIKHVRTKYNKLDDTNRELLTIIKQLYLAGIYHPPFYIKKTDIIKLYKYYESEMPGEFFVRRISELIKAGFLFESKKMGMICFEEKHLKIVVEPGLKVKDFLKSISEVFPKNVASYTQMMQTSNTYEEALSIFNEMKKENIQPTVRPYTVLLRKSNDTNTGLYLLEDMKKIGLRPDEFFVKSLLKTARGDIDKKERVISALESIDYEIRALINKLVKGTRNKLDVYDYTNLINLSGNFETGTKLFEEMLSKEIEPNTEAYGVLISLAPDYRTAKTLFDKMIDSGLKTNEKTFATLINKSGDFEIGKKLKEEMPSYGVKPKNFVYGTLINLSGNYTIGKELFDEMVNSGIKPTAVTYGTLINLSGDINIGRELINDMIKNGVEPNLRIYSKLIQLARNDFSVCETLFNTVIEKKIHLTVEFFGTIIDCAPNYEKAKEYYEIMLLNNVPANVEIYGTLMNHTDIFEERMKILEIMKEKKISPNREIFNMLISISPDYKTARKLFYRLEKIIEPDKNIYVNLIRISKDIRISRKLLAEYNKKFKEPNTAMYCALIMNTKTFKEGKEYLDEMESRQKRPNRYAVEYLMSLTKDYLNRKLLFDKLEKYGIPPNTNFYALLIDSSPDIKTARIYFNEMISKKIEPSVWTFNSLIWLCRRDYQAAIKILRFEMPQYHVEANVVTYTELMRISYDFENAMKLYNDMTNEHIKADKYTLKILFELAGNDKKKIAKINSLLNEHK